MKYRQNQTSSLFYRNIFGALGATTIQPAVNEIIAYYCLNDVCLVFSSSDLINFTVTNADPGINSIYWHGTIKSQSHLEVIIKRVSATLAS